MATERPYWKRPTPGLIQLCPCTRLCCMAPCIFAWSCRAQFPTTFTKAGRIAPLSATQGGTHQYHPGRNYYKIIPWHIFLCNNFCNYYKIIPPEDFFVMLLPLACLFLQENRPRNLFCKVILCSKTFLCKEFFCNNFGRDGTGVSRALQARSVQQGVPDTPETLLGHFLRTPDSPAPEKTPRQILPRTLPFLGHTPSTAGTFRKKLRAGKKTIN